MSKTSLAIDEKKVITVSGGRFYFESGSGRIRVKTVGSSSAEFDLSPGMGFQNAVGMDNFFAVEITNIAGIAQDIEYIISYREVFDNRVSFSELPVDEFLPLKGRTNSASTHIKSRQAGNLPGLFSCVALRNPVGSTRMCWVRKVIVGAPSVGRILMHRDNDMATVELNAAVSALVAGGDTGHGRKYHNGVGGHSMVVTDSFNSSSVGFAGFPFFSGYCPAGSFVLDLDEPIRLAPGAGLWVTFFEANIPMAASFEVVEEII